MIRSGFPSNASGPTFFLPAGKRRNDVYTDAFLERHGAVKYSTIVMTETGFLTDKAWKIIVPNLIKGMRKVMSDHAATLGIDLVTADKLLMGLTFDGFKIHLKNLKQLIDMHNKNILALVEGRDSSEINQAFDKWVAKAGKKRANVTLNHIRRSHITPVIDSWMLVLVGLAMLRDCTASNVWENSFVAVNMHPWYRIGVEDWIQKISPFVQAADKFEAEVIDEVELLPTKWRKTPLALRQKWLAIIDKDGSWDVDMIAKLREAGMTLGMCSNMFKIYRTEKRIQLKRLAKSSTPKPATTTPKTKPTADKGSMIYHLFNPNIPGMTPAQKFEHAIEVRNRTYGPIRGTTVSSHLDVEVSEDNKRFLKLKPEDVNMHRVLQVINNVCIVVVLIFVLLKCTFSLTGVHLQTRNTPSGCEAFTQRAGRHLWHVRFRKRWRERARDANQHAVCRFFGSHQICGKVI